MATAQTLDERVFEMIKLVNTREKCEFLAFFPGTGTTQKELANLGIFSRNTSIVYYYIKQYVRFIQKADNPDMEGYKLMWLTREGETLQQASRYMLITNHQMQKEFGTDVDYLGLFLAKGNPKEMIEVIRAIYDGGIRELSAIYGRHGDKNPVKMVNRLEQFGLIQTEVTGSGNQKKRIIRTTLTGEDYYSRLLKPVLDLFVASYGLSEMESIKVVKVGWASYLKELQSKSP